MNDSMGAYVAQETVKLMISRGINIKESRALILGIAFKENCPDIRNSRVIDIVNELQTYSVDIDIYDPWASVFEVNEAYNLDLIISKKELKRDYDAIILAVAHKEFLELDIQDLKSDNGIIFDVKSLYPKSKVDARL